MDLIDRLHEISARIPKQPEHLQTEEATKTALVGRPHLFRDTPPLAAPWGMSILRGEGARLAH